MGTSHPGHKNRRPKTEPEKTETEPEKTELKKTEYKTVGIDRRPKYLRSVRSCYVPDRIARIDRINNKSPHEEFSKGPSGQPKSRARYTDRTSSASPHLTSRFTATSSRSSFLSHATNPSRRPPLRPDASTPASHQPVTAAPRRAARPCRRLEPRLGPVRR